MSNLCLSIWILDIVVSWLISLTHGIRPVICDAGQAISSSVDVVNDIKSDTDNTCPDYVVMSCFLIAPW